MTGSSPNGLCLGCSAPLPPPRHSKYCSRECQRRNNKRLRRQAVRAELAPACLNCGDPLPKGRSKYCSRKCWDDHYRVLNKEHLGERRRANYSVTEKVEREARREDVRREFPKCLYCGASMEGRAPHARCCSKDCTTMLWYVDNREAELARMAEYRLDHLEYVRNASAETQHRRRAARSFVFTFRDWLRVLRRYGFRCAFCGERAGNLTREHVIPLSRGGDHSIGNIVPACWPCNSSKRASTLTEWKRRLLRQGLPVPRNLSRETYKEESGPMPNL